MRRKNFPLSPGKDKVMMPFYYIRIAGIFFALLSMEVEMIESVSRTVNKMGTETPFVGSKELDKNAFMQLLITQISYQNPLEPIENTEFIAQLAQFSSLEQMQNIAQAMNLLTLSQTAATNSTMVNLIGKRVIVSGNEITLDGEHHAEIKFNLQDGDKYGQMIVKDSSGRVVRKVKLENLVIGENSVHFDGKDDQGNKLAKGVYTYEIRRGNGEEFQNIKLYSNMLVDAVFFEGNKIYLKSLGKTISIADVMQVIANY